MIGDSWLAMDVARPGEMRPKVVAVRLGPTARVTNVLTAPVEDPMARTVPWSRNRNSRKIRMAYGLLAL